MIKLNMFSSCYYDIGFIPDGDANPTLAIGMMWPGIENFGEALRSEEICVTSGAILVNGTLLVPGDESLTIETGTKVIFEANELSTCLRRYAKKTN